MRAALVTLFLAIAALGPMATEASVPAISAGADRTCAINNSGGVRCWGDDSSGALGTGSFIIRTAPVPVSGLQSGVSRLALDASSDHTCAITTAGAALCWGDGTYGQLGTGTLDYSAVPAPVPGLGSGVVAMATGFLHTCAALTSGSVLCWGSNSYGQLGNGEKSLGSTLPVPTTALPAIRALSAGVHHTCALSFGGAVYCWGRNDYGALGNGTFSDSPSPSPVTGLSSGVVAITAGGYHSCALRSDGAVFCWGYNGYGGLGDGSFQSSNLPVPVAGLASGATSISAGGYHTCAVRGSGVVCWGDNVDGQLGNGTTTNSATLVAVKPLPSPVTQVVAGALSTCALLTDGTMWCWGYKGHGQFADGTVTGGAFPDPAPASRLTVPLVQIVAGENHMCGLTSSGAAFCWGDNSFFQLGDGRQLGITTPTPAIGLDSGYVGISTGVGHTCALDSAGHVKCWGDNGQGQLGNGEFLSTTSLPRDTILTATATAIALGGYHSCAITSSGGVMCWGENLSGQLGDGTFTRQPSPTPVANLSAIAQVSGGSAHTCALTTGGAVFCWGSNVFGQLGTRDNTDTNTPKVVPGLPPIASIATKGWHTCAVSSSGGAYCWGYNSNGMIGDGTTTDRNAPTPVQGLSSGVAAIATGNRHSCALTTGGAVLCWGENYYGELGDGSRTDRLTPVPVIGLSSDVVAIAAGANHMCALKSEGDVLCWGYNSSGGLGDGTFSSHPKVAVVAREGGAGSIANGDWYLDLRPNVPKNIPPENVPPYLVTTSGNAATAVVDVTAQITFRAQDVGHPIYVFAYVPASLVKRRLDDTGPKDNSSCVLSQITASGETVETSSSGLQSFVGNVASAQRQAVSVLAGISANAIAGSTVCVGTAANSSDSVSASNSRCVVTVPPVSPNDPLCVAPESTTAGTNDLPGPLSGLWWNSGESGWGVSFTQRRNIVFAAWYTYDATGSPKWYVASSCPLPAAGISGSCTGTLYEVNGPHFFGTRFDPNAENVQQVGTLRVDFADADHASMSYTIGSQSRTVAITRQVFATSGAAPAINYTDLWWNPSESGWGLSITHQYGVMFLAWYVYDAAGKPVWYVASNCVVNGEGCSGTVYRTTGPAFGAQFDATQVKPFVAGTATVRFTDAKTGAISYTVDGVSDNKAITRQLF